MIVAPLIFFILWAADRRKYFGALRKVLLRLRFSVISISHSEKINYLFTNIDDGNAFSPEE